MYLLKNFLDLLAWAIVWSRPSMKYWVTNLPFFVVHCSVSEYLANQQTTVLELSLSVAFFELNRTIWQYFIAFLWFILPGTTFLVTSYIRLSWNKENLLLNHTLAYRMCGIGHRPPTQYFWTIYLLTKL